MATQAQSSPQANQAQAQQPQQVQQQAPAQAQQPQSAQQTQQSTQTQSKGKGKTAAATSGQGQTQQTQSQAAQPQAAQAAQDQVVGQAGTVQQPDMQQLIMMMGMNLINNMMQQQGMHQNAPVVPPTPVNSPEHRGGVVDTTVVAKPKWYQDTLRLWAVILVVLAILGGGAYQMKTWSDQAQLAQFKAGWNSGKAEGAAQTMKAYENAPFTSRFGSAFTGNFPK